MDYNDVIALFGAIATFLFGMSIMSNGLEKLSSGRLERLLERLTNNVFKGVLLGALVTAVIQSSSTTTVMCVGFVNAGIMKLGQTVGIIMGANIGTTVTAQILSLGDLSTDNIILSLFKTSNLGPLLAIIGIILYMFISSGQKKTIGQICIGLGLLFIGMSTMSSSVSALKDLPAFQTVFLAFSNPFLAVLVGAAVTALIQSSSASVGILQALSTTGAVTFNIAMPLIMGQNIGTCITAILSSIGASKNAKRTAMVHLFFNVIGSLFFLILLYAVHAVVDLPFWTDTLDMSGIANLHIVFNLLCTVCLLPFNKQLVNLAMRLVPGDAETHEVSILDERFLASPSLALEKSRDSVVQMGYYARDNFRRSVDLIGHFDQKRLDRLTEAESAIDRMEDQLNNYLVKLTDRALTTEESSMVSELLRILSDFERIGDYSENLAESATIMHERNLTFSEDAERELKALTDAVAEIIGDTLIAYENRSQAVAQQIEPLEEVVDLLCENLRNCHIERLKNNECTVEMGTQFFDLLFNLERISDHCSNVGLHILRLTAAPDDLVRTNPHAYINYLHRGDDEHFQNLYNQYCYKYYSPICDSKHDTLST